MGVVNSPPSPHLLLRGFAKPLQSAALRASPTYTRDCGFRKVTQSHYGLPVWGLTCFRPRSASLTVIGREEMTSTSLAVSSFLMRSRAA